MPLTAAAFEDYRLGAVTFSAAMLAVLRRMVAGEAVEQAKRFVSEAIRRHFRWGGIHALNHGA